MAIPGILQQIAKSSPMLQNVKQMMGMLNASQNPQAMLNQMMSNNPQMKQVMDIVQKHGGDPMVALRKETEAAGISMDEIMGMLK